MSEIWNGYILPCVCAFLACVGFTFIFNIHGLAGKCICGLGGALGWLVYLLWDKSIPGAFFAAMCIGAFSEAMARLRRCPATAYLLVALLPLVPGGGVYYAMSYCVAGYRDLFLTTLLNTFGIAAALAIGAMLASSLFRSLFPRFPHLFRKNS
jgi:uncharacterized membrane protein YjjB (DUF3815 family)